MKFCRAYSHGDGVEKIIEKIIKDYFNKLFQLFCKNKTLTYHIFHLHLSMGSATEDSKEEEMCIIGEFGLQEPYSILIKLQ
jgi:hypothetical protein